MSKKRQGNNDIHDEESDSGSTDATGAIEFHDFLKKDVDTRDDILSVDEKRRLLSVHGETHENRVKKLKALEQQRQLLKEGKISLDHYRRERGFAEARGTNRYKANPILANKVQFSGIDQKESPIPTDNIAETNPEKREVLEYQYRLAYTPEYQARPRFNPKPTPR